MTWFFDILFFGSWVWGNLSICQPCHTKVIEHWDRESRELSLIIKMMILTKKGREMWEMCNKGTAQPNIVYVGWAGVIVHQRPASVMRCSRAMQGSQAALANLRYKWHRSQAFHISFSSTLQSVRHQRHCIIMIFVSRYIYVSHITSSLSKI